MRSPTILPQHRTSAGDGDDQASWAIILFIAIAVAALLAWKPLPIAIYGLITPTLACVSLWMAAFFYSQVRHRPHFAAMCMTLSQVLLFSSLGALLSYLLAREGGAYWDDRFKAWDLALGFDWLGYVRLIDASPLVTMIFRAAYASLIPQIIVLVLFLGFTARLKQLNLLIFAAIFCGTVTVLLSPLFPALSNYVALGLRAEDFDNVNPLAGYVHLAHFNALRSGEPFLLSLPEMQGIITFPSYHAGLSTVTLWAFWVSGAAWVRWPGSIVALLTIAATPVDGGHYLVDIIAGMSIAAASIAVAPLAIRLSMVSPMTGPPTERPLAAG
jgi:PAP2 superfamily